MKTSTLAVLALLALQTGCALTSKSDPLEIRWFSPADVDPSGTASRAAAGAPIRLGRIAASDHLRQRIVVRTTPVELASYEDRRWTEKPEDLVRRALVRALFEREGMVHTVSGAATTLEVEVLAFEEVRHGEKRAASVTLHFVLHDERVVLRSETIRVEEPVAQPNDSPGRLAEAMGVALERATQQVAARVAEGVAASPRPQGTEPPGLPASAITPAAEPR